MLKRLTKEELFVSPANSSLVFILITIGDVTDIFVIDIAIGDFDLKRGAILVFTNNCFVL